MARFCITTSVVLSTVFGRWMLDQTNEGWNVRLKAKKGRRSLPCGQSRNRTRPEVISYTAPTIFARPSSMARLPSGDTASCRMDQRTLASTAPASCSSLAVSERSGKPGKMLSTSN